MGQLSHDQVHLLLPDGWADASHVIVQGPVDPEFRVNVVVVSETLGKDETLDDAAERHAKALSQFPKYKLIREEPAKFGPHSGILREHTFAHQALTLAQLQFSVRHGSKIFTITFSDLKSRIADSRELAYSFFEKLQLRDTRDEFQSKQKMIELAPQGEQAGSKPTETNAPGVSVPRGNIKG
jgi:hypothetical protein